MKKSLTLALALALVAFGSVSWAATRPNSSRLMQKGGTPKTDSIALNSSRSNVSRHGKVTKVDAKNKNFTVEVTFSGEELKALPEAGKIYDITYTQQSLGGPLKAKQIVHGEESRASKMMTGTGTQGDDTADRIFCGDHTDTPRCCRHNGGYWVSLGAGDPGGCNFYYYYYRVTQVNPKNKTFTVEVTFSGKNLKDSFPEVGKFYDITFTQPTAGGPLEATTIHSTKSNTSY